jgi:AraC-like DNA-binding protein
MSFPVRSRVIRTNQLQSGSWIQIAIAHFGFCQMEPDARRAVFQLPFWMVYTHLDAGGEIGHESGRTTPLDPGRAVVFPAWQRWQVITRRELRHVYLVFDLPQLPASLVRRWFFGAQQLSGALACDIGREMSDLAYQLAEDTPLPLAGSCRIQSLAYRALAELLAPVPQLHAPPEPVRAAIDHADRHLAGDCRLPTLARAAGTGVKRLNACFTSTLGVSAASYVRERRIARAAELLLTSEWDLERIANESGFPNRHYLSRVFGRRMGLPPAAYRARGRPPQ